LRIFGLVADPAGSLTPEVSIELFATEINGKRKLPADLGPGRGDQVYDRESAAKPNPLWQSLALRSVAIQPKLRVSQSGDPYEQEADRVADQVVRTTTPPSRDTNPSISSVASIKAQRNYSQCEARDDEKLQRKQQSSNADSLNTAPARAPEAINSPGRPLDPVTRLFMEERFDRDFGRVRIHAETTDATSPNALQAAAYTVGSDIVVDGGAFNPTTRRGHRLLAHELAHVSQQRLSGGPERELSAHGDSDERQAEQAGAALGWGTLRSRYGEVIKDVTWHSGTRTLPVRPEMSPTKARIQRMQLTYDDGPDSAGNTRVVLDALKAAGARATFYLVGKRVAQGDNWRIVFDIAAAGNWIGNHAYDWNDATDNHIFLNGTAEERAEKILNTEWAIRDALIQGRADATKNNSWTTIPPANRDYIEDVIAHGTGRFRTPGFRSHIWSSGGITTQAALASVNNVLEATGLRPLAVTEVGTFNREGVNVDPEDWRAGRTQKEIESKVKGDLSSNAESILLHSRIGATAAATPEILADIKGRKFSFDPTVQGQTGSNLPKPPFANLSTISDPPTSAQIAAARAFLRDKMLSVGPFISGSVALGIFRLAQRAGAAEVSAFAAEIKGTTIQTKDGPIPMANWMNVNQEWGLFSMFFENWMTNKPFPKIKGVTI
jgi:peptidoglycan/xylan/chitin deacetylase (PgdA/CDA1 family)